MRSAVRVPSVRVRPPSRRPNPVPAAPSSRTASTTPTTGFTERTCPPCVAALRRAAASALGVLPRRDASAVLLDRGPQQGDLLRQASRLARDPREPHREN